MSIEQLKLKVENGVIVDEKYHNFKIIDKTIEVGDFVIPIAGLETKYNTTKQATEWIGIVYNTADMEQGRVYPIDSFDSYNVEVDEMVVVEPTECAVLKFIDSFIGEDVYDQAVDNCYRLIMAKHPQYKAKLESVFPTCPICGGRLTRGNSRRTDEGIICNDCYQKLYRECSRCGNAFKRESIESHEDFCPQCRKREFILAYHRGYPDVKFYGDNHDNKVPFMGIELEIDEGGHSDENAKTVMRIMNKENLFIYCSHDGSLTEGFEIITQPATLEYHNSIKGLYSDAFQRLRQLQYCSHDTMTCGLHVHFNRDFYRENESVYLPNLLYLVEKFWDEIVMFSRRNERRLSHYAKKIDDSQYYRHRNKSGRHDDHYYSLNISNENTIEFRMFKGTLNINTFMATLQFVNNCIICAKEKTMDEIRHMQFEELINTKEMKKYWKRRIELSIPNEE